MKKRTSASRPQTAPAARQRVVRWAELQATGFPTPMAVLEAAVLADDMAGFFEEVVDNPNEAKKWRARAETFARAVVLQPITGQVITARAAYEWLAAAIT